MVARRRLGIIGVGRIAGAVIEAVTNGRAGSWELCGLLGRAGGAREGLPLPVCTNIEEFAQTRPDLIVEMGGPQALAQHAVRAIQIADTWTISGMSLLDEQLARSVEEAGRASGHRLRLLAGAIGGLDAIATAAVDPEAVISIRATTVADVADAPLFEGSAAEVISRYHGVNVVAAAAFAGIGVDRTRASYEERNSSGRLFRIDAQSSYGCFSITAAPFTTPQHGTRTVSGSVIAALRQEERIIWAG